MAQDEKPYRVYRGGRAKGKVPTATPPPPRVKRRGADGRGDAVEYRGPGAPSGPVKRHWGRWIAASLGSLLILIVVWAVASWFAFSGGVSTANKRLDQNAKLTLASQSGLLMSHSTTILMLG